MPLYEFVCNECNASRELLLPASESSSKPACACGSSMRRRYSLVNIVIPETGRDKVLGVLNNDGKRQLPGGHKHSARYMASLAKGLEQKGQVGRYRSGVSATVG